VTSPVPEAAPMTARVLDAALAVFTERTYGGAAVPQVAEHAGIGVGTIYRSFDGKEALANAVYRRAKRALLDRLRAAMVELGPEAGTRTQVLAAWSALAAYAADDPDGFAFLEHQQHASYLDAESLAVGTQVDELAADLVRAGQVRGDVRVGDPDVLVALVFGAFVGLTKVARQRDVPLDDDEVRRCGEAAWNLLAATPGPS
jgi:AcrR family transcriptional regulator